MLFVVVVDVVDMLMQCVVVNRARVLDRVYREAS
jgi:hypothetical protein